MSRSQLIHFEAQIELDCGPLRFEGRLTLSDCQKLAIAFREWAGGLEQACRGGAVKIVRADKPERGETG